MCSNNDCNCSNCDCGSGDDFSVLLLKTIRAAIDKKSERTPDISGDELIDYAVDYAFALKSGMDVFSIDGSAVSEDEDDG